MGVAHISFDLRLWRQCRHRIDNDDIHRTRTDERLGDIQGLLAVVGLRYPEFVDVDSEIARIDRIESVLGIDEGRDAALFLGFGNGMKSERRLPRRLRAVDSDTRPRG